MVLVLALVLSGVAVYFFYWRKRKLRHKEDEEDEDEEEDEQDNGFQEIPEMKPDPLNTTIQASSSSQTYRREESSGAKPSEPISKGFDETKSRDTRQFEEQEESGTGTTTSEASRGKKNALKV